MLVELKSVSKRYNERAVLDSVNLTLKEGERLAIVGPSGSGKSTLLNVIGLLDDPDEGTYQFQGQDVSGLSEVRKASIRSTDVGFIFQLHHLMPQLSVLENVTLPAYALSEKPDWASVNDRATTLLERVGLTAHSDKLPGQLSGGERQRAAVVRALINQPKLILADEPTGALDRANADSLTALLLDISQDASVSLVVVTHDATVAQAIGKTATINDGQLEGA